MLDFNDKLKPCGGSVKGQVYRIAPFPRSVQIF